MLVAELYSGKCKIPKKFRLYHGGRAINGFLKARRGSIESRISNHVFFSANIGYIQNSYLHDSIIGSLEYDDDKDEDKYRERQLFILDAGFLSSNCLVLTNKIGWWHDEIRFLEGIIEEMKTDQMEEMQELLKKYPNYLSDDKDLVNYLKKFPSLKTKQDFEKRLKEARKDWIVKYCKVFNLNHITSYAKDNDNVILVPGPVQVKQT